MFRSNSGIDLEVTIINYLLRLIFCACRWENILVNSISLPAIYTRVLIGNNVKMNTEHHFDEFPLARQKTIAGWEQP